MFIGHFGVGFGAKKVDAKPSLGTLFFAAQFLDLLWPIFLLLGIEKVEVAPGYTAMNPLNFVYYPFTHSLVGAVVWGLLFAIVYYVIKKNFKTALLLGAVVVSHWVLDLIVHVPDLPLVPGVDLKVGFGLWNYPVVAVIVELAIYAVGAFFYYNVTRAKNKKGSYGLWGLVIFLLLIYVMSLFGSAPPNVEAIAWVGNFQWLVIIWGYWIDTNREAK